MESGQGALNLAEVRENWVGIEFDWATFDMRTEEMVEWAQACGCLLYTSPSPRDLSTSRMPSSA